jgi:hypothetical protein
MKTDAQNWPFDEPTNVAVFSIRQIVFGKQPILHVTHDSDDGSWQFLGTETPSESDLVIVGLEEICNLDPSIKDLADLPTGWEAWRSDKTAAWKKIKAD